jgi:hypothetical protein
MNVMKKTIMKVRFRNYTPVLFRLLVQSFRTSNICEKTGLEIDEHLNVEEDKNGKLKRKNYSTSTIIQTYKMETS